MTIKPNKESFTDITPSYKKESSDTATQDNPVDATAISDDYAAKIKQLKEIYKNRASKRTRGFITDVATMLNLEQHESSHYGTFATPIGAITLRISNHNAKIENFDQRGEREGVSIVISAGKNKGIKGQGEARISEFFYSKQGLEKANNKPLVKILESIEEFVETGVYGDKTGIAVVV